VFKRSKEQWKMVISQEGKKRKAVEDFINDFKFPAKRDRPNPPPSKPVVQEFRAPAHNEGYKKNGAAEVSVPEISSPIKPKTTKLSSSDTESDRLDFVIDTKGDEDLRVQMDPANTNSGEKKKKKKKKAKSYLDDL